jgi:hypothetical protein
MSKVDRQIQTKDRGDLKVESPAGLPASRELEKHLSLNEQELLQEILLSLRVIRYGSVVITVHDGHVVEIQRTERIRKGASKQA